MKNVNINIFLRLGLGFVFLYAGIASFMEPEMWISFVPVWVENFGITREFALYAHAVGDMVFGILFLLGKWKKWVGLSAAGVLATILLVSGTTFLIITFRDVGLVFAALAYAFSE